MYRRPVSDEQRERRNNYIREYRRENPDRVREWRRRYILRAAERIAAQDDQQHDEGGRGA